eukprot:5357643-Pyramimonas_sp.AAC.1
MCLYLPPAAPHIIGDCATVLYSTALHCTVLCCAALYFTTAHPSWLSDTPHRYSTVLHSTVLRCTALYRGSLELPAICLAAVIILYYTVLYCAALHCTAAHPSWLSDMPRRYSGSVALCAKPLAVSSPPAHPRTWWTLRAIL